MLIDSRLNDLELCSLLDLDDLGDFGNIDFDDFLILVCVSFSLLKFFWIFYFVLDLFGDFEVLWVTMGVTEVMGEFWVVLRV